MFVSDDVLSEQIPPSAASAWVRKLAFKCTETLFRWKYGSKRWNTRRIPAYVHEQFCRICKKDSVRYLFFSFAIYVVFILNCGSLLLFLSCVVITHLFFIFSVVNHLELREISTSQFDLGSSLYAICDDCGLSEFLATGDHNSSDDAPWTVQGKNLNHRVVYAASEMGIGREDVSKFCEILNMAFS